MKFARVLAIAIVLTLPAGIVDARPVWSDNLEGWRLVLVEGVAYITSQSLPQNCSPRRAAIPMTGAEYDKAIYSFALDARRSGVSIRVVIDDEATDCIVLGIQ